MAITVQANFNLTDSLRENFSNIITNIDPTERPLQANIGRQTIENPEFFDWQVDSLDAADTDNAYADGAVYEATSQGRSGSLDAENDSTTPDKLRAVCQIARRHVSISRRAQRSSKAGMGDTVQYQLVRRGQELLNDREAILLFPNTPASAGASTIPECAGLPSWLKTNTDRNSGSDPGLTNGEPSSADAGDIDGTLRALSEADLLDVMEGIYTNSSSGGGNQIIMVGPTVKRRISNFLLSGNSRSATQYQDQGKSPRSGVTVVGAVDYYVSDFKVASIVPNRFQRERDVFVLDPNLWEVGIFDDLEIIEQGIDGDKEDFMLLTDFTLISRDESGSGVVADVQETSAMVV